MRNLARAGALEKVAIDFTGHLTRSVLDPYPIVNKLGQRRRWRSWRQRTPDRQVLVLPTVNRHVAGA